MKLKFCLYILFMLIVIIPSTAKSTVNANLINTSGFDQRIRYVRIATDADYEFYQIHGDNANNRILAVLNQIEASYSSCFNIKFRVVFQNVFSTAADPYTFLFDIAQGENLLQQFSNVWNTNRTTICRDLAQLYSGKSQSSGVYGIAYLGAIFQSSTFAFNAVKNRTLMHLTSAHEIGHNFAAIDNPSDGNCGNNQSSVMCQGEKKDPPFFSELSKSEITNFILNHDYLTNHSTTYNTLVCSQGVNTYTVNNLPPNYSLQWNTSNNINFTGHSDAGYYASMSSWGNGSGWFNATTIRSTGCTSGNISLDTKDVWVGPPILEISGPSMGYVNNSYSFYANPPDYSATNPNSYNWALSPPYDGNSIYGYGTIANTSFYSPLECSFQIAANAENSCGIGGGTTYISIYNYYEYGFSLSPNPASEEITISKKNFSNEELLDETRYSKEASGIYTVRIFDLFGSLNQTVIRSGNSFTVPVGNLRNGNYFLQITDGNRTSSLKLIIKH